MKISRTLYKKAWIESGKDGKRRIAVSFAYNPDMVTAVKTLPGRRWDPYIKKWVMPYHKKTKQTLLKWGFSFSENTRGCNTPKTTQGASKINTIQGITGILKPFQREGINSIQNFNCRALLADEMGLGKTVQAICSIQYNKTLRPVVIIMPATLKLNWLTEIKKWIPAANIDVLYGKKPRSIKRDTLS